MKSLFNEDYFEKGLEAGVSCYSNYRWIPELTIPLAYRIIEYLHIEPNEKILDFGCAKGYLVYALRLLYREAYGYDISDYAVQCAPKEVQSYLSQDLVGTYDWIISKDVFEHIPYGEIVSILQKLHDMTTNMFCIVPLGDNGKYNIPAYEYDTTHIIRENLEWWKKTFIEAGFEIIEAQYRVNFIKENWAKYDRGNGFFILKSI